MDTVTVIIDSCRVCAAQLAPAMKSCGDYTNVAKTCCDCTTNVAKSCCDCTTSGGNSVWVMLIISITLLLLALMLSLLLYYMRKKQLKIREEEKEAEQKKAITLMQKELEAKQYEEKKHYRSMLANFLELRAKGIEVEKDKTYVFDKTLCDQYINELKSLIKELDSTTILPLDKDD